jgi:HNH endonuclease
MLKERVWKGIPGLNGYEFSNLGEIKCLPKRGNHYLTFITKGTQTSCGRYYVFSIREPAFKKQWKVHRLIAMAHKPNPLNLPVINHLDNNGLNNHIDNLEWCTDSQNKKHAYEMGLIPSGEGAHLSKLTECQVIEISKSDKNQIELAEEYGVAQATISAIKRGATWRQVTNFEQSETRRIGRDLVMDIFRTDLPQKDISEKFGVDFRLVSDIKSGVSYNKYTGLDKRVRTKREGGKKKIKKGITLISEKRQNASATLNEYEYDFFETYLLGLDLEGMVNVLSEMGAAIAAKIDTLQSQMINKK